MSSPEPEIILPHDVEKVYKEPYNRFYIYEVDGEPFMKATNGKHPVFVVMTEKMGELELTPYTREAVRPPRKKGK